MKFTIYKVQNGYLLTIVYSKGHHKSFVYKETERMTMLAKVDSQCGEEPEDAIGKELEDKN